MQKQLTVCIQGRHGEKTKKEHHSSPTHRWLKTAKQGIRFNKPLLDCDPGTAVKAERHYKNYTKCCSLDGLTHYMTERTIYTILGSNPITSGAVISDGSGVFLAFIYARTYSADSGLVYTSI